jgi:cell division protein FtsA
VIGARVEELFELVHKEIKRSGYDGLLRAGAVLTGGCALLPGIREVAQQELGVPVRVARPEKLTGMADALRSPAYSTSVGLLRLGLQMDTVNHAQPDGNGSVPAAKLGHLLTGFFRRLLPDDEK